MACCDWMDGQHRATRRHSVADVPESSGNDKVPSHAEFSQKIPVVPDGGWGWMVCLAGFGCNVVITGISCSMGILLVGLIDVFDDPVSKLSLVAGLFFGLTCLVAPIASGLLNYFSHRTVIIASSLLGFTGIFISVFSPNIDMFIVTFGLIGGFAVGLSFFTGNVIVGLYFDKKRAVAVSIASSGGGVGVFAINFFTENLLEHYGLRATVLLMSGLVLNLVVFGALCRPLQYNVVSNEDNELLEIPFKPHQQRDVCNPTPSASSGNDGGDIKETDIDELSLMIDDTPRLENISKEYEEQSEMTVNSAFHYFQRKCSAFFDISVLKNCNFLLLVISYTLWSFIAVVMIYVPLYSRSVYLDGNEIATLMSILGVLATIGQLITGFIIDTLHIKSDCLFMLSLLAFGSSTIAIPHCNSFVTRAINIAFWGTSCGLGVSLRLILTTDIVGIENISKGYSIISLFNGIGYTVLPPLFGLVYDITGSFQVIFYVVGVGLYGASILIAIIIYRRRKTKVIDMR